MTVIAASRTEHLVVRMRPAATPSALRIHFAVATSGTRNVSLRLVPYAMAYALVMHAVTLKLPRPNALRLREIFAWQSVEHRVPGKAVRRIVLYAILPATGAGRAPLRRATARWNGAGRMTGVTAGASSATPTAQAVARVPMDAAAKLRIRSVARSMTIAPIPSAVEWRAFNAASSAQCSARAAHHPATKGSGPLRVSRARPVR